MKKSLPLVTWMTVVSLSAGIGFTFYKEATVGEGMTSAGKAFVLSLNDEQKKSCVLDFATPKRFEWHYIPMDYRKGLQLKHMDAGQQQAAQMLLKSALSEVGYGKAARIMEVEKLLNELEGGRGRNIRDPQRYYFTLFGMPGQAEKWGLSVEGHHLSLNFVVENGHVVSSTPQFFAANPAVVKTENKSGIAVGTRILKDEETIAFELVNSLTAEQKKIAIIDATALKEIRDPGTPQPPQTAPEGIAYGKLSSTQKTSLDNLILAYCAAMPPGIVAERQTAIEAAGKDNIHFAWAGALEPGIGHYYRVQGPVFLIEFVNTQPDSAGNPANHIHSVWRDMRGDFAVPVPAK